MNDTTRYKSENGYHHEHNLYTVADSYYGHPPFIVGDMPLNSGIQQINRHNHRGATKQEHDVY
jgi:hypothetical protein